MTTTEMMATTRAACELSGYSNSSQILRFHSLTGRGRSSSLMKPSSSLSSIRVSQSATASSSHPHRPTKNLDIDTHLPIVARSGRFIRQKNKQPEEFFRHSAAPGIKDAKGKTGR
jgi:hypothetical protein